MAFTRPTLPEIIARVEADFVSRLPLEGAPLRRSMVRILARVVAGAAHMLHGHLDYLSRQIFPDQSDDEFLVRQASLYGIAKNPPTYAHAVVGFTGTDGTVIAAGHVLTRADGEQYTTDADATIASGTASVAVTANTAGAGPTLTAGVSLTFESPVAGVNATATVDDTGLINGSDEESTEELRTRLIARLSDPPQGGSAADYVAWAKEVAGVTRVWVSALELGPGTVVVRFVRDNDGAFIIPDAGEVAAVQAVVDERKPVHAHVTVIAPIADLLSITMLKISPNTSAIRDAVSSAVADLLLRRATPQGTTIYLSEFQAAIGAVAGISHFRVDSFNRTGDDSDQVFALGYLPTFGDITFGDFP